MQLFQPNFFIARTTYSFTGSVGNLSFYKYNNQYYVRIKGGASKQQIANSPSCAGIARSNVEFGGASHVAALLRRAIGPKLKYFSDTHMIGNLVGVLKKMIQQGSGAPGQRVLDVGAQAAMLEGFEFNADCSFSERFTKDISIVVSEDGNSALLQTAFRPARDVVAPRGATAFQLVYKFMRLPVYGKHATTKKYVPLHGGKLVSEQVSTELLYTNFNLGIKLALPLTLPECSAEGTALLCVVGIAFYEGSTRMAKDVCAMKVVKIASSGAVADC